MSAPANAFATPSCAAGGWVAQGGDAAAMVDQGTIMLDQRQ
jgi:hypothetical protein